MAAHVRTLVVDWDDPRVTAAADAERRLFAQLGLQHSVRFVELAEPAIRVRVLDVGSGVPLVLIPGGSGEALQYALLAARLPGRRLIIPNLPGGGLSDGVDFRAVDLQGLAVATLTAVLDDFGLERAPVAGSSMGGLWALWMALERPERVAAIVQFGCPALVLGTSAPPPMRVLSVPVLNRLVFPLARADNSAKVRKMLTMMGCSGETAAGLPEAFVEALARMFDLPTYRFAWLSLMRAVLRPRGAREYLQLGEPDLARIACPALFIWGDADPFGGVEVGRRCVAAIGDARLEIVRAGHVPIVDDAPACAALVDRFLPVRQPGTHDAEAAIQAGGR